MTVDPDGMLAKQFSRRSRSSTRSHVAWIIETSGAEAASEYLIARHEMNLFDTDGSDVYGITETSLRVLINLLHAAQERELQAFRKRWREALRKPRFSDHESSWAVQKRRIIEADNQRRASNPAFRQHLEHTRRRPSAKRGKPLQERMAAGWQRNRHLMEATA